MDAVNELDQSYTDVVGTFTRSGQVTIARIKASPQQVVDCLRLAFDIQIMAHNGIK